VQADIDPRDARKEKAEAEREAGPETLPWRRVAPGVRQPCEGEERERVEAERRERGDRDGAGDK